MTKVCNKCGKLLDETMFHKNVRSKDGLTSCCKLCKQAYDESYRSVLENKERQKQYNQNYSNTAEAKQRAREYRNQNKEKYKEYNKVYHASSEHKTRANQLLKEKYDSDIHYRLEMITVSLFNALLSGRTKTSQVIIERCGYTAEQLRQYIQSLFTPDMNWNNYGEYWELDHIVPRFKFYYESYDDEQFKQCWALSNLRPFEIAKNRSREKV